MIQDRDDEPESTQLKEEISDDLVTLRLPKSWAKAYLEDLLDQYYERSLKEARLYHDNELKKEFIARSTLKAFGVSRQHFIDVIKIEWKFN